MPWQAVADFDAGQRHAAGAGDGDGVLPAAIDDRFPDTLQRDAVARMTIGPEQTPVNVMTGSLSRTWATAVARDFCCNRAG